MSKFLKYYSVVCVCFLILTYALWVIFYSGRYGEIVFSAQVPENNLISVPELDSGIYRIHLTSNEKKCQLTKGGSCVIFKNIVDKECRVKINGKLNIGHVSVCGDGRSDAYITTMDLMDFSVSAGGDDILINIFSLEGDKYRPVITLTREPPNEFIKWIHPNYGMRSLYIYFLFVFHILFRS